MLKLKVWHLNFLEAFFLKAPSIFLLRKAAWTCCSESYLVLGTVRSCIDPNFMMVQAINYIDDLTIGFYLEFWELMS